VVRTMVTVAALCAVVALGGGCASHKRADREAREARAKGLKIPSDHSVLSGVASARGKSAGATHAGTQAFVAATPAPAVMPAYTPSAYSPPAYSPAPAYSPMPAPAPSPVATAAPQFQPVDPSDYAAPRPAYASSYGAGYGTGYAAPVVQPAPMRRPSAPPPAQPASAHYPSAAAAGSRYHVQKGDTLFGIARSRYGDGKRWQQIASANPGLTPTTLQAGATIVVP